MLIILKQHDSSFTKHARVFLVAIDKDIYIPRSCCQHRAYKCCYTEHLELLYFIAYELWSKANWCLLLNCNWCKEWKWGTVKCYQMWNEIKVHFLFLLKYPKIILKLLLKSTKLLLLRNFTERGLFRGAYSESEQHNVSVLGVCLLSFSFRYCIAIAGSTWLGYILSRA